MGIIEQIRRHLSRYYCVRAEEFVRKKVWQEKVFGMIPIEVSMQDEELVVSHVGYSWSNQVKDWCRENCRGRHVFGHFNYLGPYVYFINADDAMAFKLRWI